MLGRRRDQRGNATVDFIMVLFVLLPLFAGLFQLALVLHVRNTLSSAAAEGARRAAVVGASPEDGRATAQRQITGALNDRYAGPPDITTILIDGVPAYQVTISAEVPALGLGGPAIGFSVSGSAIIEDPP